MYLIKWEGYPDAENTWEKVYDMSCPDLIAEYERCNPLPVPQPAVKQTRRKGRPPKNPTQKTAAAEQKQQTNGAPTTRSSNGNGETRKRAQTEPQIEEENLEDKIQANIASAAQMKQGFEYGDVAEEILGCRMIRGVLCHWIKWCVIFDLCESDAL